MTHSLATSAVNRSTVLQLRCKLGDKFDDTLLELQRASDGVIIDAQRCVTLANARFVELCPFLSRAIAIDLSMCSLDDSCIAALANGLTSARIETLNVSGNPFGVDGTVALANLVRQSKSLTWLNARIAFTGHRPAALTSGVALLQTLATNDCALRAVCVGGIVSPALVPVLTEVTNEWAGTSLAPDNNLRSSIATPGCKSCRLMLRAGAPSSSTRSGARRAAIAR
jgi:hypothetical protein